MLLGEYCAKGWRIPSAGWLFEPRRPARSKTNPCDAIVLRI
jgi:hypothetical protein